MLYVRFPLSLRNVEALVHERAIDLCHETVRQWWMRFVPVFAADIRRKRASRLRAGRQWRWDLDEVFVKIRGKQHYPWRAVDHEATDSTPSPGRGHPRLYSTRFTITLVSISRTLLTSQLDRKVEFPVNSTVYPMICVHPFDVVELPVNRSAELGV